jgi:hypothetical protein
VDIRYLRIPSPSLFLVWNFRASCLHNGVLFRAPQGLFPLSRTFRGETSGYRLAVHIRKVTWAQGQRDLKKS